ncbi:hypothetical protein Nepgr_029086 [Nepenthes gracilis]|uniref:Uncharacterized protein n=1 Tax=Nepenthes gracilis TaxID=150966 RepID=A0AAD3TBV9_NEPGR|nr:hypothetical protein Nepgr_029086 [Nepenthes gracilis]
MRQCSMVWTANDIFIAEIDNTHSNSNFDSALSLLLCISGKSKPLFFSVLIPKHITADFWAFEVTISLVTLQRHLNLITEAKGFVDAVNLFELRD